MSKNDSARLWEGPVDIRHTTEDAILVSDGDREVWIPKSLVESPEIDELIVGASIDLVIPDWLATREGLA